jgi:hypothetical protein
MTDVQESYTDYDGRKFSLVKRSAWRFRGGAYR